MSIILVNEIDIWAAVLEASHIDINTNPWLFYNNINSYLIRASRSNAKSINA
jgi:hypothetical protein